MSFESIIAQPQLKAMKDLALSAPPGCFCEVGVYKGGSAAVLYEVAISQGRYLHLFDTFTGTPFYKEGLDQHKIDGEFADPWAARKILIGLPAAQLHIGIYPTTHPFDLEDIAFVHCDCDQYDSYRAVIDRMWPLVVPGGILLFDDYPYLPGAKQAVEETFSLGELRPCHQRFYTIKM